MSILKRLNKIDKMVDKTSSKRADPEVIDARYIIEDIEFEDNYEDIKSLRARNIEENRVLDRDSLILELKDHKEQDRNARSCHALTNKFLEIIRLEAGESELESFVSENRKMLRALVINKDLLHL